MLLTLYSLGHFAVDLVCARLILGRFAGLADWLTVTLLYNFFAFALQMPLGILSDRLGRCRICSALGAGLVCAAAIPLGTWWTVLLAGLGNALYHVGGGRETLLTHKGYGALGIFVSPGALGIFLGGRLRTSLPLLVCGLVLLALCGAALLILSARELPSPRELQRVNLRQVIAPAGLFVVVLLRSLAALSMNTPWKAGLWIPVGAVLGALGKALGGITADRLGAKMTGGTSLLLAAVLFLFPENPLCGVLAGLLFQMSMPLTLRDACLPGGEGFVFGLMTFGLFLGFLPVQYGFTMGAGLACALSALSGLMLLAFCEGRHAGCSM